MLPDFARLFPKGKGNLPVGVQANEAGANARRVICGFIRSHGLHP